MGMTDPETEVPVDRPIIIIGPHRSGTTLFYRTLTAHPATGYFNRNHRRFRHALWLVPILARLGARDLAVEAQGIWDRVRRKEDDLLGADAATPKVTRWYRRLVAATLRQRGADRFLGKYPRLSLRIPWLEAVFPDVRLIHMARDWRGVVNSTEKRKHLRASRDGGWFGIHIPGWRGMIDLPHDVAATRQFIEVTKVLEAEAKRLGERMVRVTYEELCNHPIETMSRVATAVGLPPSDLFIQRVGNRHFRSANHKWREELGEERIARLREEDPEFLSRYEFDGEKT